LRTEKFNRRRLAFAALAAGFLFLVVGGAWLVFRQSQPDRHAHFAEELTRLNNQSNGGTVTEDSVIVSPVTLRSADIPRINPADRGPVVSLVLILLPDHHDSYQVILRSTDSREEYTVENLHAVSTISGRALVFKIPSALLTRGDYALEVRGRTAQGTFESVADYNFQVTAGR